MRRRKRRRWQWYDIGGGCEVIQFHVLFVYSGWTIAALCCPKVGLCSRTYDDDCRSLDVMDKILLVATLRLVGSKPNMRECTVADTADTKLYSRRSKSQERSGRTSAQRSSHQ